MLECAQLGASIPRLETAHDLQAVKMMMGKTFVIVDK